MNPTEVMSATVELEQAVASVFETMLGLTATPVEDDEAEPECDDRISATIYFSGGAKGAVVIEVSTAQACQLSSLMLGIDPPQEVDNDVRDVLGELINVVAGNVKEVLAPESALSLPSVIDGQRFHVRICCKQQIQRRALNTSEGTVWVSWVVVQ